MDMVGNLLATERKKRGLEIIDVEQATGIRSAYLKALEEARYDCLPGEVYVKGFIRNYGNFLGLNGAHLVHLYADSIREINKAPELAPSPTQNRTTARTDRKNWKLISTVVVILLVLISAWGVYAWQKKVASPPPAIPSRQVQPAVSTTPPVAAPPSPSTTPAVIPQAVSSSKALVLIAKFNDRCWTSVIADGKALYEGIPRIGDTLTWEADRQLTVNFGNAGAVELTLNGQPVGKLGERGDVVVKTFNANPQPTGIR